MTIKQLGVLNKRNVPGRAMTVDMLLNIFLLLYFQNIYFILAAGNLGYMLSHVIALSGILLLRRDRPNWPRPIKLAKPWMWLAGIFCARELALHHLRAVRPEVHGVRLRLPERRVRCVPQGRGACTRARRQASRRSSPSASECSWPGCSATSSPSASGASLSTGRTRATSSRRRRRSTGRPPPAAAPQLPQSRASAKQTVIGTEGRGRPAPRRSGSTIVGGESRGHSRSPSGASAARPTRRTSGTSSSARAGAATTRRRFPRAAFPRCGSTRPRRGSTCGWARSSSSPPASARFFLWGFWAAAITVPIAGMLWFWYIRRWFMRRYVPSPGELPTLELEASKE